MTRLAAARSWPYRGQARIRMLHYFIVNQLQKGKRETFVNDQKSSLVAAMVAPILEALSVPPATSTV